MATIQVVLDDKLLRATDRVAGREKVNRSALIREALREYLLRIQVREKERRDRAGYERYPDAEFAPWEKVAAWPKD